MIADIRISVVLAAYNGEPYIEQQLRSLLAGLDEYDEIVLADDASSDRTVDIVRGLGEPRIRLLTFNTRVGYQRNFERAIHSARGHYIFFSDQDDVCLPARVPLSLAALKDHECVCGDAIVVDAQLNELQPSYFAWREAGDFTPLHLFARPSVIGATIACTRGFVAKALPLPARIPHDHWLSLLAAARGQLHVIRQPLILYRRHTAVASITGLVGRRRSLLTICAERSRLLMALARRAITTGTEK
jgi:glycosyltransferase involved in cell wall biosynthesis